MSFVMIYKEGSFSFGISTFKDSAASAGIFRPSIISAGAIGYEQKFSYCYAV
jgi:hypothetical protein